MSRVFATIQHTAQLGTRAVATAISLFLLAACSPLPTEHRPALAIPANYREASNPSASALQRPSSLGRWKPAEPADQQAPSPWWEVFEDPVLLALEQQALQANPDVSIAMARLQQARALASRSEAARMPEINAGASYSRQRTPGAAAGREDGAPGTSQSLWQAQASVAYELDVFGRVSSSIAAAQADSAQQQALAHQMLLLVQADVATTYFRLRQLEAELRLLRDTVQLREDAAGLLDRRLSAGAVAPFVADQARTEVLTARAEQLALEQQQALALHALVILLGQAPASFALAPLPLAPVSVQLPAGLPSALLERRPDIAAAERAMAAENARIGIAQAAFFPSFSLTGALGYASSDLGHLLQWSQRSFLLGPLLSLPIFDGGRREAELARGHALYDERVAQYRKTVLHAFGEVEDALAAMRTLDERIVHQHGAEQASSRAARSAQSRFDEGDVDYLVVVDAERTRLRSRQALIQTQGERARATVALVRALGGGWQSAAMVDGAGD